jgi:hypothetical protein
VDIIGALAANNPLRVMKALAAVDDERRNAADLTPALGEMLHNMFLVAVLPPTDLPAAVSCSSDTLLALQAIQVQHQRDPRTIHHWYTLLVDAFTPGSRLLRDDVALEMTLLRMIYEAATAHGPAYAPGHAPTDGGALPPAGPAIQEEARAINLPTVELSSEQQHAADAAASLEQQIGWDQVAAALPSAGAKTALRSTHPQSLSAGVLHLQLKSAAFARHQGTIEEAVLATCAGVTSCVWEG